MAKDAAANGSRQQRGRYLKSAARREQIVAAAEQIFAVRGYRASSLREVADLAGITLSTLQHHFPAKEELLLEVLRRRDQAEPVLAPDADSRQVLAHVIDRANANTRVRGLIELYAVLVGEASTPDHPAGDYFAQRFADLRAWLAEIFSALQKHGRLRPGVEPGWAAAALVSLWDGAQLQWLYAPDGVDVPHLLSAFIEQIAQSPSDPPTDDRTPQPRSG